MDTISVAILIAGGLIPVVESLIKRFLPEMTSAVHSLIAFSLSVLVSVGLELLSNGFNWNELLGKLATIYTISQAVYWGVMRPTGADEKIVNK